MSKVHSAVRHGSRMSAFIGVLSLGLVAGACSDGSRNMTGPSSIGGTQAKPSGPVAQAAVLENTDLEFLNPTDLTVTIQTTTTAPDKVDGGKIHLQILVDADGYAVPCGTPGGIWVRFDNEGGGIEVPVSGSATDGTTTHTENFGDLESKNLVVGEGSTATVKNVGCGQQFCIRAQFITPSGAPPKAGQHKSDEDANPVSYDYEFACLTQGCSPGFWKQDFHFGDWPSSPLPTDHFSAVFGRNITVSQPGQLPDVTDPTLDEALHANSGGVNRVARIGTAAYLSALHPDVAYPYTPAEVITAIQNAIDGVVGPISIDDLENVWKDSLDPNHCPLGNDPGDPS